MGIKSITLSRAVSALALAALTSIAVLATPIQITSDGITYSSAEAKKSNVSRKYKAPSNAKKTLDDLVAEQKSSGKWAAIVVDANQGKILYEHHAEAKRHPASLTKMMTLYLLFEAVENRKARGSTAMKVSKKAAAQPQTNVGLKAGQNITVSQAIRTLVVRSANDVAVVVAEHLGGSVDGFSKRMNAKAKELGMTNTRFYNPHGLPDKRQVTTATDMAKLSIALRRDFPGYYHHFKRTSYRFRGKTYKSHNRVLGKYPGVDGLKTGYIRASGFNLATSMTRGKTRLVAVIMGGATGAARDQEMINMLDRTMLALNKPKGGPATKQRIAQLPKAPTLALKKLDQTAPYLSGNNWAVQVGAFPTVEQAQRAAAMARNIAPEPLSKATLDISQVMKDNQIFNRSRMLYLSADEARTTCDKLSIARKQCIVIRMEN